MRKNSRSFEDASKIASLPMVSYNVHNLPNTLYMHQRHHSHQLQLFIFILDHDLDLLGPSPCAPSG